MSLKIFSVGKKMTNMMFGKNDNFDVWSGFEQIFPGLQPRLLTLEVRIYIGAII